MKAATNTIELTFERTIPASPAQVFGLVKPKGLWHAMEYR
jgi:uncharacterized protein YndB with AHSA1/START domain